MEYIYAALLLHKAGKKVDENGVKAVLTAAGVKADESRVKALIAALDGVNIEDAISKAAVAPVAAAACPRSSRQASTSRKGRSTGRAQEGRRRERYGRAWCPVRIILFFPIFARLSVPLFLISFYRALFLVYGKSNNSGLWRIPFIMICN